MVCEEAEEAAVADVEDLVELGPVVKSSSGHGKSRRSKTIGFCLSCFCFIHIMFPLKLTTFDNFLK